jgi:tetratricopeptide (TPR) repeat protein
LNPDIVRPLLPERISKNIGYFAGRTWLLPKLIEWFEKTDDRFFMLQGAPGTGKSMIMTWLAGVGPIPSKDKQARVTLKKINSLVKGLHFCTANTGSISPKNLGENLAKQLTAQVEGFSAALAASLSNRVQISATISDSEANSITGIYIKELNLGGLDDDSSFNLSLRAPLKKLYESGYNEPMIILVDALDESLTYSGQKKIVEILAGLSDIPKKARFIVTTRPDPAVLVHFQNIKPFDLVKDAPQTIDDIYLYVLERMQQIIAADSGNAKIDSVSAEKLATKISEAAKGIFLYAHLLFNSILPKLPNIPEFIESGLPEGLGGLYNTFLNNEIGTNNERWYNDVKPLLGLISVSQGKGLTKNQLNNIIGHDIEYSLLIWKEYLEGPFPDGPFRVFHRSFSDFLLEDRKDNINRPINAQEMHKKIIDYYWQIVEGQPRTHGNRRSMHEGWKLIAERDSTDAGKSYFYPLYHLVEHLDFLLVHDATDNITLDRLYHLARDEENFAKAQAEYLSDIDLHTKTIRVALSAAARVDDAPSIAEFMITHARRVVEARKKVSPLLMLRNGQDLERIWKTCDLYDIDISSLWYLLVAWELYDNGTRLLDAKNTLKHLSEKRLAHVAGFNDLMTLLLTHAYNIDRELFEALCPRLLHYSDMEPLLKEILKAKDFDMAEKIRVKIADNLERSSALEEIAKAQAQAGDIEEAKKTAEEVDGVYKSSALSQIAAAQAQAGDIEEAKKTAEEVDGVYKSSALSQIAAAQAQAGDIEGAKKTAEEIGGYWGKPSALIEIAAAQAQAGDIEGAKKTAEEITRSDRKSSALTEIAAAQAQAGDNAGSRATFQEAIRSADETTSNFNKSSALTEIAKAQAQAGDNAGSRATFQEAIRSADEEDEAFKLKSLQEIAEAQAQAGDNAGSRATFQEAIRSADEIRNRYIKSSTLSQIAKAQAQAGDIEEAKKTAEEIGDNRDKSSALIEIAEAQAQAGDNAGSRATSSIILDPEIEKKIDVHLSRVLLEIAKAQAQAGDNAGSRATFQEAIRSADEEDGASKLISLEEIVKAQAQAGDNAGSRATFQEVIRSADEIDEADSDKSSVLAYIASQCAQAGDIERAKKIVGEVGDTSHKSIVLAEIAVAQAQAGDNAG